MRKLIIKVVLFLCLALLAFKLSEKYFIKENRFNYANYKFNELSKDLEFDLLFFGSSKSYCAYNPAIFQHNLNLNAFNLAGQDQTLDVTAFVIDEALKKSKPKLIIVDVSESKFFIKEEDSNYVKRKAFQFPIYDNYGLSLDKMKHIKSIYNSEQLFYAMSPVIRNHGSWMSVFDENYKKSFLEGKNNIFLSNNGYIGTLKYVTPDEVIEAKNLDEINDTLTKPLKIKINPKEINILKNIKTIADKNQVDLLFVSTPEIKDYNTNLSFYDDLYQVFDSMKVNYLNLYKDADKILGVNDFKDIVHLNYKGGYKISHYLSEYLAKQYNLSQDNYISNLSLNKNITYHLLTNLKHTNKLIDSSFSFNKKIECLDIGYFKEAQNRFVFIMKINGNTFKENELDSYFGYLRYYNGEIIDENKKVKGFPLKTIEINNDKFIFVRAFIKDKNMSKFDLFFLKKKNPNKTRNVLTIKNLKLEDNAVR